MAKPEWGTKRTCPKCGTRFYDLQKDDPVVCINCGNEWSPEPILKSKQPLPPAPKKKKKEEVAEEEEEAVVDEGEEDIAVDEETDVDLEEDEDEDVSDVVGDVGEKEE